MASAKNVELTEKVHELTVKLNTSDELAKTTQKLLRASEAKASTLEAAKERLEGESQSVAVALKEAMGAGKEIVLCAQRKAKTNDPAPEDIFEVGTLGTIRQLIQLPDGTVKVLVMGVRRVRIERVWCQCLAEVRHKRRGRQHADVARPPPRRARTRARAGCARAGRPARVGLAGLRWVTHGERLRRRSSRVAIAVSMPTSPPPQRV